MYCLKHTTKILKYINHVYSSRIFQIDSLTLTAMNEGCNLNKPFSHIDKTTNNNASKIETTIATVLILNI
jgi:hypothetical protein